MAMKQKKSKPRTVSRTHKPEDMTLEEWQRELRRQFGRKQTFNIENLGDDPVFSEFSVHNPEARSTYRVTIRGAEPGENHCTCGDFVTNALGTCKHLEAVLGQLESNRRNAARLKVGHLPTYSEIVVHYGIEREIRFRPGSDCPKRVAAAAAKFFDVAGVWTGQHESLDELLTLAAAEDHELRCADDVLADLAERRDRIAREAALAKAFPKGIRSAAWKNLLKVSLYDYQRHGALFAARAGRCLIADEMGLGKTIQAIAAAEILARHGGVERVLIVCPTSLKHQWKREIEKFSGRTAEVIGGTLRARTAQFQATRAFFVIVNYDTVHHDLQSIERWSPDLVILDEAQRIKNWSTRTARSVKRIAAPHAIVLTGTPLENRLEELVSIVQFVDRHRLGPTYRLLEDHTVRDEVGKVIGYRDLDKLGATLEPILLRRLKEKVLRELPERIDTTIFVPMTEAQRAHHDEAKDLVARIVAKWRRFRFLSEADKQKLMCALQTMRMACDSAYLVDGEHDSGPKADEVTTLLRELVERPGAKVVVFSQWVKMHALLMKRLRREKLGHVFFHGGVPGPKRGRLIDQFRDDPACRVFLSTDAGGVGLNLQHAAAVINVDLPWNPAVLEQRIGRVHRLGQKQPVRVVNFVSQGTIEEGMLGLIGFKKSLFTGVLDGGAKDISLGGPRLKQFLDTVEKATAAIPPAEPIDPPARTESRPVDPMAGLLEVGMALVKQLSSPGSKLIQTDTTTGERFLKLPVPEPKVMEQLLSGLTGLLNSLKS